jgi:tetratricopeptide (TPR) repeat protein
MGRLKLLIPFLIILGISVWAVPAILKAMPDRYVMRLPEPLQKLGLPEDGVAILPTIASPIQANDLLLPEKPADTGLAGAQVPTTTPEATSSTRQNDVISKQLTTVESTRQNTPLPTPIPSPTPTPWPLPATARLNGFQHQFQEWNNCGPATLAMALTFFDMNVSQQETATIIKPNPEDRNVSPHEMAAYVNEQTPFKSLNRANGKLETLRRFIANDIPVIIELGIEPPGEFRWLGWYGHYLLVVAYDDTEEQFWVYDSWFGTSEEPLLNAHPDGRKISYADLDTYWPHFNWNYIALYQPEQTDRVAAIVGNEMDDRVMWENLLERNKTAVAGEVDNAFYWFNLGTAYNALEKYTEAATAFDQARAIGLPWRMLWYQFGPYEAYFNTGRYDDVILLADVTLKDRPYFEESYYYKGLALEAIGDANGAKKNFELAVEFNPTYSPAADALAKMN